jgi:hypothetical protein
METTPKKMRRAELITVPNMLKQKVGDGGLDEATIARAEEVLQNNNLPIDFVPVAIELLTVMEIATSKAEKGAFTGEPAIEALLYPAVQLKAQGAMFRFPLISEIGEVLVNFLESVESIDKDMLEVVTAHRTTIAAVIVKNMSGEITPQGQEIKQTLADACDRYYKTRAA